MTERRKTVDRPSSRTWTPSPSSSPSSSPPSSSSSASVILASPPSSPTRLHEILSSTSTKLRRPSQLNVKEGKDPLLKISKDDLRGLVWDDEHDDSVGRKGIENEEEEVALWEHLIDAVLWTIPFGFLHVGMDIAVHAQFGQTLTRSMILSHLYSIIPTIYFLNLSTTSSSPTNPLPSLPSFIVSLFESILSIYSGLNLIRITTKESYLKILLQAPSLGTLWCWSIVRIDLSWAILSLFIVGARVWSTGQLNKIRWW